MNQNNPLLQHFPLLLKDVGARHPDRLLDDRAGDELLLFPEEM